METCPQCQKVKQLRRDGLCRMCHNRNSPRTCPDCGKVHASSSGNKQCPSCVHRSRFHPCVDCGEPCDPRVERCHPCAGVLMRGENSPMWQGGRVTDTVHGYVIVKAYDHPRANKAGGHYVREHILVAEEKIGRYLRRDEQVHHINGDKQDNRPENLEVMTASEHTRHHNKSRPRDDEGRFLPAE